MRSGRSIPQLSGKALAKRRVASAPTARSLQAFHFSSVWRMQTMSNARAFFAE